MALRPEVPLRILSHLKGGKKITLDAELQKDVDSLSSLIEGKKQTDLKVASRGAARLSYPTMWAPDPERRRQIAQGCIAASEVAQSVVKGLVARNPEISGYREMIKGADASTVSASVSASVASQASRFPNCKHMG